jgi:hypothetical protein
VDWSEVFSVEISDWGLDVRVGPIAIALLAFAAGATALWLMRSNLFRRHLDVVKVDVPAWGIPRFEIRPNDDVIQIAHCAWVELATRKAGLEFDEQNDVIVDVYSSWYELFREMRRLASGCPAGRLARDVDTQKLIQLIVNVLNEGLRPHLTIWQARLRRWYANALTDASNRDLSPQEIQRQFPEYEALLADLKRVNKGLIQYKDELELLARRGRPLAAAEIVAAGA